MNKKLVKQLSLLAVLEGISYLALGLTMYFKYVHDMPKPNYIVGMAHGVLFIMYCLYVMLVARNLKWSPLSTFLALGASLLPIATFIVDYKMLKPALKQ